jgi:hypothetical protein
VEDHTSSYPDSSPAIISLTSKITLSCRLLGIHMRLSKRQRHTHALDDFRRGSPSGGGKTDEQLKNTPAINLGLLLRRKPVTSAVFLFRRIRFTFGKVRYLELTHAIEL